MKAQLAARDQVIGEVTVANRILKKVGQLKVDETLKSMVQGELLADRDIRLTQVLGRRFGDFALELVCTFTSKRRRCWTSGRAD